MQNKSLSRLREIRDARKAADALIAERDALIRAAVLEGHSQRAVADAAGVSPASVNRIARSG